MKNRFSSGQLAEKAMFWQAKSFEKTGLTPEAATLYKNILSLNSYSYYTFASIRALEKLGVSVSNSEINKEASPLNEDIGTILPEVFDSLLVPVYVSENSDDASEDPIKFSHFDKAKELLYLELSNSASTEIEAAKPELEKDNYSILQVATLYYMAKDYINSEKVISQYYSKLKTGLTGPYLDYFYYLIYPYGYKELVDKYSGQFGVDPMFALAVIREESRFNPQAGSYAGAQGLMQIMPATGKSIAGSIGVKNFSNEMLLDPETSIMMGCYYLGKQLENFNQNEYYACGAYNGGPGAMSRWVTDNGSKEIDEFIEYVTYEETRNYIKKVMASYYFYKILYE
jgi:soluble lytic murein transglycosylase